jgi:hypothetical protein
LAATATSFGDGVFGIGADQVGIILESTSYDYTSDNKTVRNRTGNTSGITFYNETVKISLDGKVPATSPFSGTIAASLTLGNAMTAYLKGGVTGGLTIIEQVTVDSNQEDYKGIKVSATFYPNITS